MTESQSIEYKSSWRDDYLKWICGFANAQGGVLTIGKDDDGKVTGISNSDLLLEQLPNKIRDHLGVLPEINIFTEDENKYIEINVQKYEVPISFRGKYYLRSGSTLQELKGIALNEFILKNIGKTWDDVVEVKASINDIDPEAISAFIRDAKTAGRIRIEDYISTFELLTKLRLLDHGKIKRADVALFGKEPGKFFLNIETKLGRFSGNNLRFQEVISSNIVLARIEIVELLEKKFFIQDVDIRGMQRFEKMQYPIEAVREMVMNALVHRNFQGAQTQIRLDDDHFSVWNDGGLPSGITEEDLRRVHHSKPRNPLIADVCFKAGYIDAWGSGTLRIIETCFDYGLAEPELREEQGGFVSRIFGIPAIRSTALEEKDLPSMVNLLREKYGKSTGKVREKYGKNAEEILAWLDTDYSLTIPDVANKIGISESAVEKNIRKLKKGGLLKRIGAARGGHWKVIINTIDK